MARFLVLIVFVLGFLSACSSGANTICSQAVSVPSFTTRFLQGLDNFSEDQYENLRVDTNRTRATVVDVLELFPGDDNVAAILQKIDRFILAMDDAGWDVSVALNDVEANEAADDLGTALSITQANEVDAHIISRCGLPSTFVQNDPTVDTLPMPWIPAPTDTEPETNLADDESEILALGQVVGTLFQLTLTEEEVRCLGSELVGVVDRSDASANIAQYKQQYQRAFDNCSINFTVPLD